LLEMTQAEYARHRGVTKQAIGKLVKAGKIAVTVAPDGRKTIDAAAADCVLGEVRERIIAREEAGPVGSLTKAKTATEQYRARTAQLDFEERTGHLLRDEDVTAAAVTCCETLLPIFGSLPKQAERFVEVVGRLGVGGLRSELKKFATAQQSDAAAAFRKLAGTDGQ
jgi:hypothetical protein